MAKQGVCVSPETYQHNGWIFNYQIEHHLFPTICHVHYKAISSIVKKTAKEFGLRYNENRTFFSAIGSHIRMLRALGR